MSKEETLAIIGEAQSKGRQVQKDLDSAIRALHGTCPTGVLEAEKFRQWLITEYTNATEHHAECMKAQAANYAYHRGMMHMLENLTQAFDVGVTFCDGKIGLGGKLSNTPEDHSKYAIKRNQENPNG